MEMYHPDAEVCPKCGGRAHLLTWLASPATDRHQVIVPDRLRVACARCGYAWLRTPLDATKG